jgi:hypothetical protein
MIWKMERGTRREKIILSNKPAILNRLVGFAKDNQADTTIHRDAVKINEIAKPYIGENFIRDVRRSDKNIPGSISDGEIIPKEITSDLSSGEPFEQNLTSNNLIVTASIIGTFIIAMLIWRSKSK